MMAKQLYVTAVFCLGLASCQGASEPEGAPTSGGGQQKTEAVEHSSEGVVGPDEAFFAALYLQKAFQLSQTISKPSLAAGLKLSADRVNAYDFAANYTEKRLELMSHALLQLGDSDGDKRLNEAEFQSLKLDLSLFGLGSGSMGHQYNQEIYRQLTAEGGTLGLDEIKTFLRGLAPAVKEVLDQSSAQDQRLEIIRSWQNVLKPYDKNGDGSLSIDEQRNLRVERQAIITHIQGPS